jgi:hypothetical protein
MSLTHSFLIAARQQEVAELQTLSDVCELVRCTGELIHALQAERGTANALLASGGQALRDSWLQKRETTDTAATQLSRLLNTQIKGSSRLYGRIALATDIFDALEGGRSRVDELSISPVECTRQYTDIVDAHIAVIFEAVDAMVEPAVSRLLLALFNLIEGKEYAGLERANGVRFLASEHAGLADQQTLANLIERQEQSLARFETFCGDDIRAQWLALQSTLPLPEFERLRRQLLSPNPMLSKALIGSWFDICTVRIDGFHRVEQHLTDRIKEACRERITETEATLAAQRESLELSDEWVTGTMPGTLESKDHTQRLSSRLNRTLMDLLQQQSADLQTISVELSSVRAALEDRKLIERAKGLLIAQKGISEEAAYTLLRQKAMSQNLRVSDVANALLGMADLLPPPQR